MSLPVVDFVFHSLSSIFIFLARSSHSQFYIISKMNNDEWEQIFGSVAPVNRQAHAHTLSRHLRSFNMCFSGVRKEMLNNNTMAVIMRCVCTAALDLAGTQLNATYPKGLSEMVHHTKTIWWMLGTYLLMKPACDQYDKYDKDDDDDDAKCNYFNRVLNPIHRTSNIIDLF